MTPDPTILSPRRRRWFLKAVLLLLLVLGVLWLLRGTLFGPLVARIIAKVLTSETGGHAEVGRAAGGWLGDARLSGVAVTGPGSEPGWRISAQQVAVDYDLALLFGDLSAMRAVTVAGLQITIDAGRMPVNAALAVPAKWPPVLARLPASLPQLTVAGGITVRSVGHAVSVSGLQLNGADQRLELTVQRLAIDDRVLPLPPIVLKRTASDTLSLAQPLDLALPGLLPDTQRLQCDQLRLTLGETQQQLQATGRLASGTWQAVVSAQAIAVTVKGVDLVTLGVLPEGIGPLLVDADVEHRDGRWTVRSLHAVGPGVVCDVQTTVVSDPWRCTEITSTATVDLARLAALLPGLPRMSGMLHATLNGGLPCSLREWNQGQLALAVTGSGVDIAGRPCTPLAVGLTLASGEIRLDAVDVGWGILRAALAPVAEAPADEAQAAVPAAEAPAAGRAPAAPPVTVPASLAGWRLMPRPITVTGGTITLTAHGGAGDGFAGEVRLDGLPLAELLTLSGLRHLKGTASGTLNVSGPLAAPEWIGALSIDGIEAKLSPDIPTFTAGSAHCTLAARVLTLVDLQGDLGGELLNAQGRVLLDGGEDALAVTCHGRNLLLVQRHDARVRADLDLRLTGRLGAPLLAGEVVVTSALITPELNLRGGTGVTVSSPVAADDGRMVLFELPDPPLSTMRFDLHLTTAPDSGPVSAPAVASDSGLRVVTRWGRGTCDLDLHLGGTGAAPVPEGRVTVRNGVATLPFSTLAVTHGQLVFPPGDPFQPRITATATAHIRRYDVQVQVTGPLYAPQIRASGSGLDEQEALLLLTTGSTPRELQDEKGQLAALSRVGSWLGQETWRKIEGPDDPEAGPSLTDRVTVEWGRETSTVGRDTIDAEVELTPPGSRPAVLLTGERDRYDQYNAGITLRVYWGGEEP